MIEDEELGLKLAESEEEATWTKVLNEAEQLIKMSKANYMIQIAMRDLAKDKLEKLKNENESGN